MKAIRWSDNDHYFGPFTYCKDKYHNLALVLGSGDEEDYPGCRIRLSTLGHTLIAALPPIIKPWRQKIVTKRYDEDMTPQSEREWSYLDVHEREYGFSYGESGGIGSGGFLQVFLGAQTHDSSTTQDWSCFTPWNNWRHVRHSYYDLRGNHFGTAPERTNFLSNREAYDEGKAMEDSCPTRTFYFTDFDGERLQARTRIEERQWELGTGWCKWMSWFKKPIIQRSLDIEFSGETGKKKGSSWKGGTIGHSIEMKSGELHNDAFMRYCEQHEMVFKGEGIWTR